MAERNLVVDHLKLSYEGLFRTEELYAVISSFFFEKGWDWYEHMNQEQITPNGKQIHLIFEPWKSTTEYHKISVRLKINLIDLKEVEVEHEGKILRLDQGVIRMTVDGYVISDRKNEWNKKPFLWFISILMEKYFFKSHYSQLETWIKRDIDDLHNKIKAYLNVSKYAYHA